ncbi:MAG: hypothetical protein ACI4I6_08405 [Hominimerdicola sp.]
MQNAKTNKKQFLEKMDALIPWQDWVSILDPIYYEGKVEQKPYAIELMLRIYILQNFYDLADMAVMNEILIPQKILCKKNKILPNRQS